MGCGLPVKQPVTAVSPAMSNNVGNARMAKQTYVLKNGMAHINTHYVKTERGRTVVQNVTPSAVLQNADRVRIGL